MMVRARRLGSLILLCSLLCQAQAAQGGQVDVERELADARALYDVGRFGDAIPKLLGVVAQLRTLEREKVRMADAHLLLGLSYFAMRDETATLENFRQASLLDPDRRLDPDVFSPRIVSLFDRARADADAARAKDEEERRVSAEAAAKRPIAVRAAEARPEQWLTLSVGSRVRLQLNQSDKAVVGSLLSLSERSFALLGTESRSVSFPRDIVRRVEISSGRKNHWLSGLIAGCALGVVVGVTETPACTNGVCTTRAQNISDYTLGFGIIGALVGALIKTDRWVDVPTERLVNVPADSAPAGARKP